MLGEQRSGHNGFLGPIHFQSAAAIFWSNASSTAPVLKIRSLRIEFHHRRLDGTPSFTMPEQDTRNHLVVILKDTHAIPRHLQTSIPTKIP